MSVTVQPTARAIAGRRDEARRDLVSSALWLAGAGAVGFALAADHPMGSLADALTTLGRAAGIAAASMMMTQLLLISRNPLIERRYGHDRAAGLHARLGKLGILVLAAHVILLSTGYGARVSIGPAQQLWEFATLYNREMTAAVIAFALILVVVITSLALVRSRWPYERWHAVHLITYVAVAIAIPHQFELGTTFSGALGGPTDTAARIYWAVLWVSAIGSFVVFRIVKPLVAWQRDALVVSAVSSAADGTTSVEIVGPGVSKMRAKAGQFMLWRFLAPGLWREAHPYSLSAAPDGKRLRISVKGVGTASAALAGLRPGTRVAAEGPLGRFTLDHRLGHGLVLAASGSGVAPIRSLLEECEADDAVVVLIRARSEAHVPHLDEIRELALAKGATLHLLLGSRGEAWLPAGLDASLTDLAPGVNEADVYVCGPRIWAEAVLEAARKAGVSRERLHVEEFAW